MAVQLVRPVGTPEPTLGGLTAMIWLMPKIARFDGLFSEFEEDARFAAAVLFGSAARGMLRSDSDVDVAVLYVNDEAREQVEHNLTTVLGKLAMACGRDVHLIDLDRVSSDVGRAIFAEGKTLFDRSQTRLREVHARVLRDYFDWPMRAR